MLERYQGQFINAVSRAEGSAARLAELVVHDFPSFNDVAEYRGEQVRFYKRAQLLASNLWGAFGGKTWGAFSDMGALTAFADYKLPQLLREYGVLEYSPELAARVDSRTMLLAGSPEEVEIRAATVQACELLRDELAELGISFWAFQIDWLLWNQAQGMPMQHPYHLTRTIYY